MGYYSDVRVSTTQAGFEFLKEHTTHDQFSIFGYVEEVNDDDGVVFGWNNVKWYPCYDEVAEFKNLLAVLEDKGIPWEYMEVGEDNTTDFATCCRELPFNYDNNRVNERLVYHLEARTTIWVWSSR